MPGRGLPWWCKQWSLPAVQQTWVWSLGQKDPLEKEITTHSNITAWQIPWTEEPGGLHWVAKSQTRLSLTPSHRAARPPSFNSFRDVIHYPDKEDPRLKTFTVVCSVTLLFEELSWTNCQLVQQFPLGWPEYPPSFPLLPSKTPRNITYHWQNAVC